MKRSPRRAWLRERNEQREARKRERENLGERERSSFHREERERFASPSGEREAQERERRREEDFPPPASSRDGRRDARREKEREKVREKKKEEEEKWRSGEEISLSPLHAHAHACARKENLLLLSLKRVRVHAQERREDEENAGEEILHATEISVTREDCWEKRDLSHRILSRVIVEVRERSTWRINQDYFQLNSRGNSKYRAIHFVEHFGMFYKTSHPMRRGERVSRFNDLCRSSSSPVTWPYPGRVNSLIRRSRLISNYLKQKQSERCLQKWQQVVVAAPVPTVELEHLHQRIPARERDFSSRLSSRWNFRRERERERGRERKRGESGGREENLEGERRERREGGFSSRLSS